MNFITHNKCIKWVSVFCQKKKFLSPPQNVKKTYRHKNVQLEERMFYASDSFTPYCCLTKTEYTFW